MDFLQDKKIERLILKDDDVLVVTVPKQYFMKEGKAVLSLHKRLKEMLLPRKNKILILPEVINISVIGKEQIDEYISHIDLWSLFDDEENGEI
jgi:hypothetical protein